MKLKFWMTAATLAALVLAPAIVSADENGEFEELLRPLKPAKPILPPVNGCVACEDLGHICPVCKERALRALAEGKALPTEPPKVLPDDNPAAGPPAHGGGGDNPLVPVAKMMREVEEMLKSLASKRAVAKHQELIDIFDKALAKALDKELADAMKKQKNLLAKMDSGMGKGQNCQKEILKYLDALIKQAEEQQCNSPKPGPPGPPGSGPPKPGPPKPGPPKGTDPPSSPAATSALVEGEGKGIGALQDLQRGSGERFWAQLPVKQRAAIVASYQQQFPDNWRDQLERYFKALSKIRRGEEDGR